MVGLKWRKDVADFLPYERQVLLMPFATSGYEQRCD